MGRAGGFRRRRRPLTRRRVARPSQREREVGLRPEDRRDQTTELPTPRKKAQWEELEREQKRQARKQKRGRS